MNARIIVALFLVFGLTVSLAQGQEAKSNLEARLRPIIEAHQGKIALGVKHLGTGEFFFHNKDLPMPTASLIKFPVMVEAYRQVAEGKVDLNTMIELKETDKVPGSGILTIHFSAGMRLSLRDAIRLMIAYSDNTATNLVVEQIGLKSTAETMEKMGFANTKLHSKVFKRETSVFPERSKQFGLGSTCVLDMINLLEKLHSEELVDAKSSKEMLGHMLKCEDQNTLPRFLPTGTKVAMKTGAVSDVRTAAGILMSPSGPIAVCVLTSENKDQRWSKDNAAERVLAETAREAYNHFQSARDLKPANGNRPSLKLGAEGPDVVNLQRLLNAHLKPSPDLQADGEFGPMTESNVMKFQRQAGLPANGVADAATWAKLGPNLPNNAEAEPPAPEVVNAEKTAKKPADPDQGAPWVTAKAWVALDSKSGERIGGLRDQDPLPMASTTKIMTAHLVIQLAEKDPKVLDEVITFSSAADNTPGSTSGVIAGERVTVKELLSGLMLPSGNDAATAFAEHFGRRLTPKGTNAVNGADPALGFIAAMNQEAETLGLKNTKFANPHGLPAKNHHASASDLAKLASVAMKSALFREVVGTSRHGARLIDGQGKSRNVVWKNTNQLIGQDGYDGVKTGTTTEAGACLVASGKRGSDQVLIVLLGSANSEARYADARNLFRWVWSQRGKP